MDRNEILNNLVSSYQSYATADARGSIEKVLKYSGRDDEIVRRADVKREAAVFRYLTGIPVFQINAQKPLELEQDLEVMIFVEQGDSHSIKSSRYERLFDIGDQLIDWSTNTEASNVNSDLYTLSLTGVGSTQEREGFLSMTLNFQIIIKLQ